MQEQSRLFKGSVERKQLVLELEDGEDLFECLRQGMLENNIEKASIVGIEGIIKEASISFFSGSKYKFQELKNLQALKASGKYELKGIGKELFGNLHIIISQHGKNNTVTLLKAKASEGLKARLEFVEVVE